MTNFSPMEEALLTSLQESAKEHEQRLSALETLLQQLNAQSKADSDSGNSALKLLQARLDTLDLRLSALTTQLANWEPLLKQQAAVYSQAVGAFNSMRDQYLNLAEEAKALRSEVTQLRQLAGD